MNAKKKTSYRVYHAPDGCAPEFCGEFDTRDEAVDHADTEPGGLPESLWATARAAGHCAGMYAPDGGVESKTVLSWHGEQGYHAVVAVEYDG